MTTFASSSLDHCFRTNVTLSDDATAANALLDLYTATSTNKSCSNFIAICPHFECAGIGKLVGGGGVGRYVYKCKRCGIKWSQLRYNPYDRKDMQIRPCIPRGPYKIKCDKCGKRRNKLEASCTCHMRKVVQAVLVQQVSYGERSTVDVTDGTMAGT